MRQGTDKHPSHGPGTGLSWAAACPGTVSPDMPVACLLAERPGLVSLFIEMRLGCAGCSMARFCSLKDVCSQYGLTLTSFLADIEKRSESHESNSDFDG